MLGWGVFGLVAVIGGGGKTSWLERMEVELHRQGRPALLTTSTKLGRDQLAHLDLVEAQNPGQALEAANQAAQGRRRLLVGPPRSGPKLSALPPDWLAAIRAVFPRLIIIVEADGAQGRPFKAHALWEPVIPPHPAATVALVGLSGLGRPLDQAVHRPEELARLLGLDLGPENILTPETAAAYIIKGYQRHNPDLMFFNQAEDPASRAAGLNLMGRLLAEPTWSASRLMVVGSLVLGQAFQAGL